MSTKLVLEAGSEVYSFSCAKTYLGSEIGVDSAGERLQTSAAKQLVKTIHR